MKAIQASATEQGFALVIVLWVVALLSIVAASLAFSMRTETTLAHDLVAQAQARALAEAGLYRGILRAYQPRSLAPLARRWKPPSDPLRGGVDHGVAAGRSRQGRPQ